MRLPARAADFTGLRAMYVNCTLNRSPDRSHTQGVIDRSVAIMEANGVGVDQIRAVDHDIATGVRPDMTDHGWDSDEWPALHIGFTVPPQADAGWLGEVGPGPSYLDEGSGGPDNDFTHRNLSFTTYNLLHLAAMIRSAGGFPAHGNQRTAWDAGTHPDHTNPEYR